MAKAGGSAINGVELHALEDALPDDVTAVQAQFSIYEDIREKLITKGVPATEVAFIHEANTDARKRNCLQRCVTVMCVFCLAVQQNAVPA